jgi:hypothetical protein
MNFHSFPPRRGVILLVLLGMLALFTATAFAFVVIASHARQTSHSLKKMDRVMFSPRQDLDAAMRQALRDTRNTRSVARDHSLLGDVYGNNNTIGGWVINPATLTPSDGVTWENPKLPQVDDSIYMPPNANWPFPSPPAGNTPVAFSLHRGGGQIIEFVAGYTIPANQPLWIGSILHPTHTVPLHEEPVDGVPTPIYDYGQSGHEFRRRVGCVLTITDPDSALYNKSTRIVGYWRQEIRDTSVSPPTLLVVYHRYQVLAFDGVSAGDAVNYFNNTKSTGYNFVINGAPFSGMGAGYRFPRPAGYGGPSDPGGTVDAILDRKNSASYDLANEFPYALLPNPTDPDYYVPHPDPADWTLPRYIPVNSSNEDYDAPDIQNMLLAMEVFDGTAMNLTRIPSLHRPALATYWVRELVRSMVAASVPAEDAWRALIQPYGRDGVAGTGDDPASTAAWTNTIVTTKRRCLMRPLPQDHRNFDGSNDRWQTFIGWDLSSETPTNLQVYAHQAWGAIDPIAGLPGPWDVDNDGDGLPDSVWVDIGLPVRSMPDGRLIKPLVALHCIDLDSKINLNTAGSVEQLHQIVLGGQLLPQHAASVSPPGYCPGDLGDRFYYAANLPLLANPVLDVNRGQGCGPADTTLYPLFKAIADSDSTLTPDQKVYLALTYYRNLLLGDAARRLDGRYGEIRFRDPRVFSPPFPPTDPSDYRRPAPGMTYASGPSEQLLISRMFGFPPSYYSAVTQGTTTGYGSPMDLKGSLATGLDFFGQPIYSATQGLPVINAGDPSYVAGWRADAWNLAHLNTPYELKLGPMAPEGVGMHADYDNPFTIAEHEPLLRRYDADVLRLPARLRRLLNAGPNSPYRFCTTTQSWDIPVPSLVFPENLREAWEKAVPALGSPCNISDLIAAKAQSLYEKNAATPFLPTITGGWPATITPYYPYYKKVGADPSSDMGLRIDVSSLLSTDALLGLRMDLNSPFGDGQDNNANGLVDEYAENEPATFVDTNAAARYKYARTLYVLMMALVDQNWYPVWDEEYQRRLAAPGGPPPDLDAIKARARARALAQWAINIVDARDSDSIMTPFEYDIYPFAAHGPMPGEGELVATWNVDGNPETMHFNNPAYPNLVEHDKFRGIVWGCERPELLITETLAFHDRGTRDTNLDPSGQYSVNYSTPGTDPDFDQVYRPQGSLFVELFNPWGDMEPGPPELYSSRLNPDYGVQLSRISGSFTHPTNSSLNKHASPVWRLAIMKAPDGEYRDPDEEYLWKPSGPYDPAINPVYDPLDRKWERLVYLTPNTYDPSNLNTPEFVRDPADSANAMVFFPSLVASPLGPQSYAVVGPGDSFYGSVTRIGETRHFGAGSPTEEPEGSLRRIALTHNGPVNVFADGQNDVVGTLVSDGNIKPPMGIVVNQVLDSPDLVTAAGHSRRLSVSEPDGGYAADAPSSGYNRAVGYNDTSAGTIPLDEPEDKSLNPGEWYDPSGGSGPLAIDGTTPSFRYVHLQRLANPELPYNPTGDATLPFPYSLPNPYITVDSSPVDLTVFNTAKATPTEDEPEVDESAPTAFRSRQRGEEAIAPGSVGPENTGIAEPENLWTAIVRPMETDTNPATFNPATRDFPDCKSETPLAEFVGGTPPPLPHHAFREGFAHTLGFLNEFMFHGDPPDPTNTALPQYYGRPLNPNAFGLPARYLGAPGTASGANFTASPFPWLNWLNRPFANSYELMTVPSDRQSRLLVSHVNAGMSPPPLAGRRPYIENQQQFPHLMNFFSALKGTSQEGPIRGSYWYLTNALPVSPGLVGAPQTGAQLYRLLEYVHVPSRFVDSQMRGNPSAAALGNPSDPHVFHPPKNFISTYREPGKTNLNTMTDQVVWNCLANDHSDTMPTWLDFLAARRGYVTAGDPFLIENADVPLPLPNPPPGTLPTRFANPFRSPTGADLVPPLLNRGNPQSGFPASNLWDLGEIARGGIDYSTAGETAGGVDVPVGTGVNATLLRAIFDPTNSIDQRPPLFTNTKPATGGEHRNFDKSPFFRYQSLQRLSNLATNRSNVYALWVTVGYFEAEKYPGYLPTDKVHQQVYADGYTYGPELGIDSGDVTRHRAFYIIDRSIPVGFIPGEDLNTENAILLRRFIE